MSGVLPDISLALVCIGQVQINKFTCAICISAVAFGVVATPSNAHPTASSKAEKNQTLDRSNLNEKINGLSLEIVRVRQEIDRLELEKKLATEKQTVAEQRPTSGRYYYQGPSPTPSARKHQVVHDLRKLQSKLARLEQELADAKKRARADTRNKPTGNR